MRTVKTAFRLFAIAGLLLLAQGCAHVDAAREKNSLSHITVNLEDGSRIEGETTLIVLPLSSQAVGHLNIPIDHISTIKVSDDRTLATVALCNGDQLQGAIDLP